MSPTGIARHDHDACIAGAMDVIAAHCRAEGFRMTPLRRRVLEILLDKHRAMRACDILDILRDEGLGTKPPEVYRALGFLTGLGVVHRIEQLNAFIACAWPEEAHAPVFLICRSCGAVTETRAETPRDAPGHTVPQSGSSTERTQIEVEGLCPRCQSATFA